jgi:hypothetical protein
MVSIKPVDGTTGFFRHMAHRCFSDALLFGVFATAGEALQPL